MKPINFYLAKIYTFIMAPIGNLLTKKKRITFEPLSILVNRADRLGDAAISLPIIAKLNTLFNITVAVSKHNSEVFKRAGIKTITIDSVSPYFKDTNWINWFKQKIKWLFYKSTSLSSDFDVYLNFIGSPNTEIAIGQIFKYSVSICFGLYGKRYDYTIKNVPNQHICTSMIEIVKAIKPTFNLEPSIHDMDKIVDKSEKIVKYIPDELFQVFHIGGKNGRLVDDAYVIDFLISISVPTIIIDSPEQTQLQKMKSIVNNNYLIFIEEQFSLFELLTLTVHPNCTLYIGFDSGNSHFLHVPTNCLIIYTVGDHHKWRPYSGIEWELNTLDSGTIMENSRVDNKIKCIGYKKAWCRPCVDILCSSMQCTKLNIIELYKASLQKIDKR